uniref:desmoplakin-A-like isoform X2 n=1 Tax=Semicossyphus pulcher TaxID=241346 RepID=UPI0037E7BD38
MNYGSENPVYTSWRVVSGGDLTGRTTQQYDQSENVLGGGSGYDPYMERYNTCTFSQTSSGGGLGSGLGSGMTSASLGGMKSGDGMTSASISEMKSGDGMMSPGRMMSGSLCRMKGGGGMSGTKGGGMSASSLNTIHQKAMILQGQCQDYLKKADYALQTSGNTGDAQFYMAMAKENIEQYKNLVAPLRQLGQPNDSIVRNLDHLMGVHMSITDTMKRKTSNGSAGCEELGRSVRDAISWIAQQKRLIETASWGGDAAAIDQQLVSHQRFHSSIQRSPEVDRARNDLMKKGDKGNLHALEQEWDSLQKMSIGRTEQLQELQKILQEMSREIMWVNEREEEELVFDWGDKNIDQYIPRKQEGYSKLMSALEDKEKDLNKLKGKVDTLLKNEHPASDKIEAYEDTLQTQWSWLLQITKCIDVHLKENAAYNQFFKEANETHTALQKEHEMIRKKFTCNKKMSLEDLLQLHRELESEKIKIMEHKRQVQHLVNKSKSIVRLKPRNPEEKSSSPVIVKALCDFKQDQKVICKDNEAILKDNSQRGKWQVTGPGGLDMTVPSVCLIVPPPNPISVSLANKNEQYYETILSIWNQLNINIRSLVAWQYCLLDIKRINSFTLATLARMRPEEYRQIIKTLETRFEEFKVNSHGSEMFSDEDKRAFENQFTGAQTHYHQLLLQHNDVITPDVVDTEIVLPPSSSSRSLSELHALRLRLEGVEDTLSQHIHICLGDDGVHDCGLKITQLETVQRDVHIISKEFVSLRDRIMKELEGMNDSDKDEFLRSEITNINTRLGSLESRSSAYSQRLRALRDMLESVARAEDIVKVYEARLTEKETTSLTPSEVEEYMLALKTMKSELDHKKYVLTSMEAELAKVSHCNSQVGTHFHRCDMLSKYMEQVTLLSDRWRRILGQIDNRVLDLQSYRPQLQRYKKTSTSLSDWIDVTRKKQDTLRATKIDNVQALQDHIDNQKALNSEIRARRETVDSVLLDNEACVTSIKDYETDLASYTSGLETLLNIPIKRTMLKSPSMDLNQEATQLQTRYMELLTQSGDYYKFLGELLKNMEELKIRDTRIGLLEEELPQLREDIKDRNYKIKSLEDAVSRYQLEISELKTQLLSTEEVTRKLHTAQRGLADLNAQVSSLTYSLEEERRKKRLVEERYAQQQEEYEAVLRKRQKELETVRWSKVECVESVANKEQEIEHLRRQRADEAARVRELQMEISEITTMMQSIQSKYSEIVSERDALLLKLRLSETDRPEPQKPVTVQGLRDQVSVTDLVDANLLKRSDLDKLKDGRLTIQDIEDRLRPYLRVSTCIAGIYDEAGEKVMPIYQAMKDGLLRPGTTLELLEAQAASGFIVDPVNNLYLSVSDAYYKGLFGPEYKDKLLSAESAVTGYKLPGTDRVISLFQAIERGLVDKGHGVRLLEAQIASGGIIDPGLSARIDLDAAYRRGYLDEKMNKTLTDQSVDNKGFFDPNTEENLTYLDLKKRCVTDKKTGLLLLSIKDKTKLESHRNKRRVIIVDPATNQEMTVREAYDKGLIGYDQFVELSEQESEWEEITITAPDGSTQFFIVDKKTGRKYDITELLEKGVIHQSDIDQYRSRTITLTQFADIITHKYGPGSSSLTSSTSRTSASKISSSVTSSSTFRTSGAWGDGLA